MGSPLIQNTAYQKGRQRATFLILANACEKSHPALHHKG
jgi:hypothetical protein